MANPEKTKTAQPIQEQKCPACGAPMYYDPKSKAMVCDYCGTTAEIEKKTETIQEQISRLERDKTLQKMKPLPVYNCLSCGAEVITTPEGGAMTCPYCKNHIVLTEQFSGEIMPDGIIPFKITSNSLKSAIWKFYKDRPLLAKTFFTKQRIGKVTGIYVPFWLFDCKTTGDVAYQGERRGKTYRNGDYLETPVEEYRLERGITANFENITIDASKKMKDALMDSICPFNFNELVPFDVRYLAGYVADRFDQTSEDVRNRNDQRVSRTVTSLASGSTTAGFSGVNTVDHRIHIKLQQARYVLLPVYLVNIEYEGKTYPFAVNGQTGRVTGTFPTDIRVSQMYFLKHFAIGFAAMAAALWMFFVR